MHERHDALHMAQLAIQREFADEERVFRRVEGQLIGRTEHAHGDGQIVSWPLLWQIGRREVDDEDFVWEMQATVLYSRAHSFATLTHGGTGQADDGKGGDLRARVEICFDVDDDALDADQGAGVDDGEHGGLRFVGRAAFSITCLAALFSGGPYSPSRAPES